MEQERQRAPPVRLLLLLLLLCHVRLNKSEEDIKKKFGDKCGSTDECGFEGAICDDLVGTCLCKPELPVSNHLDKCGIAAKVNESCFFNEQCETVNHLTECKDGICTCRFQRVAIPKPDGLFECIAKIQPVTQQRYVDPAMIGILVAMFLMFITICVVLRLFSRARWRENRTIFNTPNPRLMNVSLLRDNKLSHHERRGSQMSHAPSRPASMNSLQPHSPVSQGSRGESKSSSVSGASEKISKSLSKPGESTLASTPMLENTAAEIRSKPENNENT